MTGDYNDRDLEVIARMIQRATENKWTANRKIRLLESILITACQLLSAKDKHSESWQQRYKRWKNSYDRYLENGIDFVHKP